MRITLHGSDGADIIAKAVLADLGLRDVEIVFQPDRGAIRLGAVEMVPRVRSTP